MGLHRTCALHLELAKLGKFGRSRGEWALDTVCAFLTTYQTQLGAS